MSACPHVETRWCPLYVAAHDPRLVQHGCADSRLDEGGCAVDRGKDYQAAVNAIAVIDSRLLAELRGRQALQQRIRNMRAMGLH
jgi:hypothetical protein